jgi:hypothetical protein
MVRGTRMDSTMTPAAPTVLEESLREESSSSFLSLPPVSSFSSSSSSPFTVGIFFLLVLRFLCGSSCALFNFFGVAVVVMAVTFVSLVDGGSGRVSGDGSMNLFNDGFFLLDLEVETLELLFVPLLLPLSVNGGKAMTTTTTVRVLVVLWIDTK